MFAAADPNLVPDLPAASPTPDRLAFLHSMQLSDSALPIGRFVHSHGLEAWLQRRGDVSADVIRALVEATVCQAVAPLDGTVLAHAHRADTTLELRRLDNLLTARKLTPAARHASQACGRQLSRLAAHLTPDDPLVNELAAAIRARETDGNLAIIEGTLARALGLSLVDAVLVELRGSATTLLSAGVRLGALTPVDAQTAMAQIAPALIIAAGACLTRTLYQLAANAPELEIAAMAHARADARLFAS